MRKPNAFVLWRPGTNCHLETAHAFTRAGANSRIVLWSELDAGRVKLTDADLIAWPGGFADGDHFRAGAVAAIELLGRKNAEQLQMVREKRIPMIGICNGFQILVATGILPDCGKTVGKINAVLDQNLTTRFEHWWNCTVVLQQPRVEGEKLDCLWIQGLEGFEVSWPVAHTEGRLVAEQSEYCHVVATYGSPQGIADYPVSPNGSPVAGICSADGTVVGFMPHPERRLDNLHGGSSGLFIFQAAVRAVR